jgi:hypothetical protein
MAYVATLYRASEHRRALESLWREDFDPKITSRVDERMSWLYEANPRGAAVTYMTVVQETNEPVGCASYIPREVYLHGEPLHAGVLCDFAVNKQNRIAGAAIAVQRGLAKSSWPNGFRFLYGFPNEASVAVCKRVGYKPVGATATWTKPIRSAYKLGSLVSPILERPASAVIDAGLSALDAALGALAPRALSPLELEKPDERFDRLWERSRPKRGIAGERSAAYLEWRYTEFTSARHWFFCLTRDGGREIAGYAVYSIDDHRAILQDLFAEDFEGTADALLVALARHLRSKDAWSIVLSYLGPEHFGRRLRRLGFFKRPGERTMVVYRDPALSDETKREIVDPANWFILDGELDI